MPLLRCRPPHGSLLQFPFPQQPVASNVSPEFARAPRGPPSNVAVAHVRLGGRATSMGKVGDDEFEQELVMMMNNENVQTRGVKIDGSEKTGCAFVKTVFDGKGKMKGEVVKEAAEDSLLSSELNLAVLKEAAGERETEVEIREAAFNEVESFYISGRVTEKVVSGSALMTNFPFIGLCGFTVLREYTRHHKRWLHRQVVAVNQWVVRL